MKYLPNPFLLLALLLFCFTNTSYGQLTNVKTVGGTNPDYATLSAAITALNSSGVGAGGVTFDVAPGHTENAANLTITASGTASDPIVFRKAGAGANPLITATAGTAATDGIIKIAGGDYITFNGIDVAESSSNTTANAQMEWGYLVCKSSATNGAQYISISNCTVTLLKSNTNTKGIYVANHTATSTTALSISTAAGMNTNIDISNCYISNSFSGIYIMGPAAAAYFDDSLNIGTNGKNIITNFGGSGTAYGIYVQNFRNAWIMNDSVYNNLTPTASSTHYGIYTGNAANANVVIANNGLQLTSNGSQSTRANFPIFVNNGSSDNNNTILVDNNRVVNGISSATSTIMAGVQVSSTATTVISNNTISGNDRAGTSSKAYYIYTSLAASSLNIYGNTISSNTSGGTAAQSAGIWVAAGTGNVYNNRVLSNGGGSGNAMAGIHMVSGGNIYGNTISLNTCTGTSASVNWINIPANGGTVSGNTISDNNSTGTSQSINCINVTGDVTVSGNTLLNNISGGTSSSANGINIKGNATVSGNIVSKSAHSSSSTGSYSCIIVASGNASIYGNRIDSNTTAGNTLIGIELAGSASNEYRVYRNKIYGFYSSNSSCIVSGIRQSNLSTAYIYNNLVGMLSSGASSTTANAINGINISSSTAGTISNIYHNTVYLNATSTCGSNCIMMNTTATTEVSNNILVNLSNVGTTVARSACALRRSSTTFGSYATGSDNNYMFVGSTPTLYKYIFSDGTNSFQTIAMYRTFAVLPDQASKSDKIDFASLAGTSADFLQPVDTAYTESSGKIITGMIDDYLLDSSRLSYPLAGQINGGGSSPDIGAHELDLIFIDNVPPAITFDPINKSIVSWNKTLNNVTITDKSGVNVNFGSAPRLYFKKSTDANVLAAANNSSENGWKYAETFNSASPFSFTIDYTLLYQSGAVADGDVIQYFVVAQDNFITPNVGVNTATFSSAPASAVLTSAQFPVSSPLSYTIKAASIPSNVTVGASGSGADYTSLTGTGGLFEAINNGVVSADVTAYIISDLTENGAIALNKFAEDGFGMGFSKLYIQPQQAINYTIYGSSAGVMIRMNDAERVVIDGSFFGSGNYLSFVNNPATGNNAVFQLAGTAFNKGCRNITIKNCIIWGDSSYRAGSSGIFIGGTSVGSSTGAAQGYNNRNITLENNKISKVYTGILINGFTSSKADSIYILNNEIGTDTVGKYIGANGILMRGVIRGKIWGNKIYNIISPYSQTLTGISFDQENLNTECSANRISNVVHTANASVPVYAIYSGNASNNNLLIKNNAITRILGQGAATDIQTGPVGIYLNAGTNLQIVNNSVSLGGNRLDNAVGNAYTSCLYVRNNVTGLTLVNNVLKNVMTSSNVIGPGSNFAIVTESNNTNAFARLSNNLYYAGSSTIGMVNSLGLTAANLRTNLSAWRSFASDRSLWGDPGFVSDDDITPDVANPNTWNINGRGYPLAQVADDINNFVRSSAIQTGSADIGATEFTPTATPPAATASAAPAAGTTTYYTIAQDTVAEIAWASASVVPSSIAVRYRSGTIPPSPGGAAYMDSYLEIDATPGSGFDYRMTVHYKTEAMNTVNESALIIAKKDGAGPWVPFTGGATTTNTVTKRMSLNNLSSFSLFAGTDANNPLPVKWVEFSVVRSGVAAHLKWTTAQENNSDRFEIERMVAGGVFEKIGIVEASGNSDVSRKYTFADEQVAGYSYLVYRIRVIDRNGEGSFSKQVALDLSYDKATAQLAVYPNPFNNKLSFELKQDISASVEIRDVAGVVVYTGNIKGAGAHELSIGSELAAGVYFVVCKETGETFKIVKL